MFCERCGTLRPTVASTQARSPALIARRLLDAVGLTTADGVAAPLDEFLHLCLNCRGYSCPACWNDAAGVCQTCAPLPEPEPVVVETEVVAEPEAVLLEAEPQPEPVAAAEPEPEPVAAEAAPQPEPPPPTAPRMPVLPLPRPRSPSDLELPMPALPEYPNAPLIHFEPTPPAYASAPEPIAYAFMPPPPPRAIESPGLQPCRNCELTLSARARFCRRCGTAQAD